MSDEERRRLTVLDSQHHSPSSPEVAGALSVGDVVRSTINPELRGRIVWRGPARARIELLTHPTAWWEKWGKRPVPMLVENLELVRAAGQD
jgi:hypothetical protein